MQAQKSTLTERLGQIEPVEVDGEVLWEAEEVYRAFHLDPRAASKCIRREHKRKVFVFRQGYTGMEELDGFPNPEDYYSWIWIDAICSNCGTHIQGLIDVETA